MDKREIFDHLDNFSQNLMLTLADVEAMKKTIETLIEENTSLKLESTKLRERLSQLEGTAEKNNSGQGAGNLEKIYEEGSHVCTVFYGQRRVDDEACAFCLELLYRET